MAWITEFADIEDAQERARKAVAMPIGLASPLWLAFGAAASAGVAWWLMTRWAQPSNLEAIASAARAQVAAVEALVEAENEVASQAVEVATAMFEPLDAKGLDPNVIDQRVEIAAAPAPAALTDDLTQLAGVGPKLAAALAQHGVTTFAGLASWSDADAKAFDDALNLKGRVARDAWVAQARRLANHG